MINKKWGEEIIGGYNIWKDSLHYIVVVGSTAKGIDTYSSDTDIRIVTSLREVPELGLTENWRTYHYTDSDIVVYNINFFLSELINGRLNEFIMITTDEEQVLKSDKIGDYLRSIKNSLITYKLIDDILKYIRSKLHEIDKYTAYLNNCDSTDIKILGLKAIATEFLISNNFDSDSFNIYKENEELLISIDKSNSIKITDLIELTHRLKQGLKSKNIIDSVDNLKEKRNKELANIIWTYEVLLHKLRKGMDIQLRDKHISSICRGLKDGECTDNRIDNLIKFAKNTYQLKDRNCDVELKEQVDIQLKTEIKNKLRKLRQEA